MEAPKKSGRRREGPETAADRRGSSDSTPSDGEWFYYQAGSTIPAGPPPENGPANRRACPLARAADLRKYFASVTVTHRTYGSRPTPADRPQLTLDIANAMVGAHKRLFGRGPTRARVFINGDSITCTLEGGFTRSELTMIEAGEHDAVRRLRAQLHEVSRDEIAAIIEGIVGRRVRSYTTAIDTSIGLQVAVFVLEGQVADSSDSVTGRAHASQARSRELREDYRALTAQHQQASSQFSRQPRPDSRPAATGRSSVRDTPGP